MPTAAPVPSPSPLSPLFQMQERQSKRLAAHSACLRSAFRLLDASNAGWLPAGTVTQLLQQMEPFRCASSLTPRLAHALTRSCIHACVNLCARSLQSLFVHRLVSHGLRVCSCAR